MKSWPLALSFAFALTALTPTAGANCPTSRSFVSPSSGTTLPLSPTLYVFSLGEHLNAPPALTVSDAAGTPLPFEITRVSRAGDVAAYRLKVRSLDAKSLKVTLAEGPGVDLESLSVNLYDLAAPGTEGAWGDNVGCGDAHRGLAGGVAACRVSFTYLTDQISEPHSLVIPPSEASLFTPDDARRRAADPPYAFADDVDRCFIDAVSRTDSPLSVRMTELYPDGIELNMFASQATLPWPPALRMASGGAAGDVSEVELDDGSSTHAPVAVTHRCSCGSQRGPGALATTLGAGLSFAIAALAGFGVKRRRSAG